MYLGLRQLAGRDAIRNSDLVDPSASRVARRLVETRDVGLEVDDGCPVHQVDAGEGHSLAGHFEYLYKAEPDRVDPPWSAASEDAHPALLTAEQERDLPERHRA